METIGSVENNKARFPHFQQLPQPLLLFFRLRQILKTQNLGTTVVPKSLLEKRRREKNNLFLYIEESLYGDFARQRLTAAAGRYSAVFAVPGGVRNR